MKFEAIKDFRRPRAMVLQKFRDPERFETVLKDFGTQLTRVSEPPQTLWECSLNWHNQPRPFTALVQETTPDTTICITLTSDMALAEIVLDFYDLPDGGCRVIAVSDLTARTMIAKAAVQSLRLVRGKAEDRLGRFIAVLGHP